MNRCFTLMLRNELKIAFVVLFSLALSLSAEAQSYCDLTIQLRSLDNDVSRNITILDNGRWRIVNASNIWHKSGEAENHLLQGELYYIGYTNVINFYNPTNESYIFSAASTNLTNYYIPYSNSLSVVVTGITTSASATWHVTPGSDNKYTNSSTYITYGTVFTNSSPSYSWTLSTIPTGTYSIAFNSVRGHQSPYSTNVSITGAPYAWFSTNTYIPYSNSLSVVVTNRGTNNVIWTLTSTSPDYTNALVTGTSFTNSYSLTMIPTGSYTITFPSLGSGYTAPAAITTNIIDTLTPTVTGEYSRIYGNLQITMTPAAAGSNAPWILSTYPLDGFYTNITSGTGNQTIYHVPIGSYVVTFQDLAGYTTPSAGSGTVFSNTTTIISGAYTFSGHTLVVHIGAPFTRQQSLEGIGNGPCRVEYGSTISTQSAALATYSVNDDDTVTLTALTNYVYKWYINTGGGLPSGIDTVSSPFTNSYSLIMSSDYDVWLLYSSPYNAYDHASDIDHDQLPDRWEITWFGDGGNTESAAAPQAESFTNTYANPDNDFIPSTSTNPPMQVQIDTNSIVTYSGAGGTTPGYPLQHNRLLTQQEAGSGLGYATGLKFDNLWECRGLDGYYLTNGPSGQIASDDPLTDPTKDDTDGDNMTDGWEYYFWYWRSADAYSAGLTNSANLSWVTLKPIVWNMNDWDTDNDELTDLEEHDDTWTDPTHCDTDADAMDDYFELQFDTAVIQTNALDYANNWSNPDGDFMALSSNTFILTVGMAGTALGTNVCWSGGSAAIPNSAWNEIYTNTGANVFDLYRDTVLKAAATLTHGTVGTRYAFTNYYGTNTGLTSYKNGYPVWVDVDNNGIYSAGDYPIVNPNLKHDGLYRMAPATPHPGVCSFDPRTAWTNNIAVSNGVATAAVNTLPYTTYQEYLGGDYIGRLSWDAGGQMSSINDDPNALNRNSYSNPQNQDTDADEMPDGWELYAGLDDNNSADASADPDEDKLSNHDEWANAVHSLGNCAATWPNKLLPTDPGFIIAPSPNDPHPRDTDWDGLGDSQERTSLSCPTTFDTDGDLMPDGWEIYAGSSVTNSDAEADSDNDGLDNYLEYWTGAVDEWQYCDAAWTNYFMTRKIMPWDKPEEKKLYKRFFIPPDFLTCGSFMLYNGVITDLDILRTNYPATKVFGDNKYETYYMQYHTTYADDPDSDGDGMDDFWEVYHGLNPCKGSFDMMMPATDDRDLRWSYYTDVDFVDADSSTSGFQFGTRYGGVFNSLSEMVAFVNLTTNRGSQIVSMIGPFNFGLEQMDPDGDGLPNMEEYSYSPNRVLYHTDPTPIWRTEGNDASSFVSLNYTWDYYPILGLLILGSPFNYEELEGYDTDNDGVGDYAEINSAAGQLGNNPLDARNPIRNRALYVNGTNDFARTPAAWTTLSETFLTRFCVEAWVKPDNPARSGNHVVLEKASLYRNPYNPDQSIVGANFRLGITNGLPFVLYNGRGSLRAYQATAQTKHRIQSNTNWTHIAGSYDGTNLTIYVNGEESYSLRTTELPATGVNSAFSTAETNIFYNWSGHSIIIGAADLTAGYGVPYYTNGVVFPLSLSNYFGGCIDEARIWDGTRTRAEVLASKNRRISRSEIASSASALVHYYSFDDVPDPNRSGESRVPSGMTDLDTTMSFHPTIAWWAAYPSRSTVYTGLTNSYNYLVSAEDHVAHMSLLQPLDDYYHFSTNFLGTNTVPQDYNNFSNPYGTPSVWGSIIIEDAYLFMGARGVATNSWLSGLTSDPDSTDTDGDGLPDWWEQLYNLDPNDATGDNGAWGDVDNDGLNNRAEYLAGTNPRNSDTDGDGIGDYDSRSGPYTRTWGEMFMDGDGMPDVWEMQYGLDPYHYDAHLDLDKDGWSNFAEYQAGTNPNDATSYPQPSLWGTADYFGNKSGILKFFVYNTNTMDGTPKFIQQGADNFITETIGTADGTLYFKGRLPLYPIDPATVVNVSAVAGTNNTIVTFTFTGPQAYTYSGPGTDYGAILDYVTGRMTLRWASVAVPILGTEVSVAYNYVNRNAAAFRLTGFGEGDFYLLALLDSGNNTFDAGEPMGIMENQPLTLGHTTLYNTRVHVKDTVPGYGRFAWTGNTTGTSDYPVVINKISEAGAPPVLTRTVRWSRSFMHEWDYQIAGLYGLPTGNYQWWMNGQQGTFSVTWPAAVATPTLVYPRGDVFNYAVNQLKWTMDVNSTKYHLQVARQAADRSLAYVLDQYYPTPYCDQNGVAQANLPLYAGELGDGIYYWRVASWSPAGESAWSEAQTFEINLAATNSHWIAGDIYYFGKADCENIIVEAFNNRGFSGKPEARVLLTGAVRSNSFKGSFTLRGLEEGTYYVRAYLDVTPAGGTRDGKRNSPWESWGFIRDPNNDYQPRSLALLNTFFIDGTKLVIRDQDTDNDLLPDAWEMFYFGNLDQTGDMDYDGDGETNLEEYMRDGVDMNPAIWDTDGDGLSDAFELNYTAPSFGYSAKSGMQLNPNLWDTDGDGYSDGAEMKRYHTNPLDPTSYPHYQPMCFDSSRSPGDYDGDGRSDLSVYDIANGNWYVMTAAGQFGNLPFGSSATQPMLGDYDGDGCDDFAIFEPATGAWHLYNAWTGQSFRLNFGDSEMMPVPADYDGDSKTDLAVYYPADGMWFIYSAWSGQFYSLQFGGPTCVPVPGDYNNDGAGDLATYEPNTGDWNIFAFDHYRHEGTYYSGNFGGPTMLPAGGDYDGDGRNDAALFDASTGWWHILTWRGQFLSGQFGGYGCIPAPGDYDGDGRTDICVYYPPTGTWYIYCWSGEAYQVQFGFPAATPALKGR